MQAATNTQSQTLVQHPSTKRKANWWQVWKGLFNFWLDVALFLTIVFVVWVTILMQVVFPIPTAADGWELWGLTYNHWHDLQFFGLCVFALLAVEHLVLHWNWVCSMIATKILHAKKRPDEGTQAILGVGTLVVLLLLSMVSIIAAIIMVKDPHM